MSLLPAGAALAERSPNTSLATTTTTTSASLDPEKHTTTTAVAQPSLAMGSIPRFEHKKLNLAGMRSGTYVSPSDAMQSPTTKKLSKIKGRRYGDAPARKLFGASGADSLSDSDAKTTSPATATSTTTSSSETETETQSEGEAEADHATQAHKACRN